MDNLLIKNATIVLPNEVIENGNCLVSDGKILCVNFSGESPKDTVIIDATGKFLFAGFVELHVHGGGNADFMDATKDAFETAIKTHLKYGTTTIVPTAMSASYEDICAFLSAYKEFNATSKYSDLAVGVHLEGPYFSNATAKSSGAQPKGLLRDPDKDEMEKILNFADGDIVRWDAAPELCGSDMFAREMTKRGIIASVAHSDATAAEAQSGFENGFSHATHFLNATSMHRKINQTVFAGVMEATYLNDDVTIELISDGRHICKEDFQLAKKIKGVEKISVITDAMRLAGTDIKKGKLGSLKNGTDCVVDDTVAKLADLSSYAGSICTMERALGVLCRDFGFSESDVSVMMSLSPAKLLKLDDKIGSIAENKNADLLIVNKDYKIETVIKNGKIQ